MNADFEVELAHDAQSPHAYRRTQASEALNRRLAPHLLRLARPGDGLLYEVPWTDALVNEARGRAVELVSPHAAASGRTPQAERLFTPWGWTRTAAKEGTRAGADVRPPDFELVARVNSKLWSHALEVELGWALRGARVVNTPEELSEAAACACPRAEEKWVVKSPYGFAARERVLGRGPRVEGAQAAWACKRLARGEPLIFQPWLEVVREYGVVVEVVAEGAHQLLGVSDLRTNGAGTGVGYVLARPPEPRRMRELEETAAVVCERLRAEGYQGPAGFDALEHAGGLHPLLEVNARYTMGFIALAVERELRPAEPTFWDTKTDAFGG